MRPLLQIIATIDICCSLKELWRYLSLSLNTFKTLPTSEIIVEACYVYTLTYVRAILEPLGRSFQTTIDQEIIKFPYSFIQAPIHSFTTWKMAPDRDIEKETIVACQLLQANTNCIWVDTSSFIFF